MSPKHTTTRPRFRDDIEGTENALVLAFKHVLGFSRNISIAESCLACLADAEKGDGRRNYSQARRGKRTPKGDEKGEIILIFASAKRESERGA